MYLYSMFFNSVIESDPQLAIQINYYVVPKQHNSDLHEVWQTRKLLPIAALEK